MSQQEYGPNTSQEWGVVEQREGEKGRRMTEAVPVRIIYEAPSGSLPVQATMPGTAR